MPRTRPPTTPPDLREQELTRLRTRVAELERALAEPERVARALRESEAQFRALVASVPGMMYRSEARPPWRDLFVSDSVFMLCGYEAEELTRADGTAFGDLIIVEDRALVEESINRAAAQGGTFDIRYQIRHADGRIRWVHDQGKVTTAPDGTPLLLDGVVSDITERIEAEIALRKNEEQYCALVASVPGAVYLCEVSPPWKDTLMSSGVFALTGYTAADLLRPDGITIDDLTFPEDLPAVTRQLEEAITTGQPYEARYRIRHADGSVRWVQDRGQAAFAPNGTPRFLGGVILDITDRMHGEEILRESEARYRTLVTSVPGAVFLCEPTYPWTGTFMSAGVVAVTGYPEAAYSGSGENLFTQRMLPEDLETTKTECDRAIAQGEPWTVRYRIRHADGGIRWVFERGQAAYGPDNRPLFLGGIILDITDRVLAEEALREREERLRAIVENEPECVKLVDREGNVLEMNQAGLRMLEADSLDQLLGRCVCPLIAPADEPAFREMIAAVFQGESRELVFEVIGLRGGHRVLETHSVPLWDGPQRREVRALLGVTRDITERRRAEQIRQSLEAQLRKSQKLEAIGTLAGGIAHDFNNILAAVIGHAELLAQDVDEGHEGQESIRGILLAGARAKELVQQILTFSRLRERERRLVSLEPIVLEALKLLRPTLPATIEIRAEIDAEGAQLLADSTQMHQVVVNLCTNAAYAMREHGGLLEVQCRTVVLPGPLGQTNPGRYVQLTVRDTGAGMDAATLDRVFDPFFTTKPHGEGTGLGLAVVHGIVQSHDGLITASSELGHGTRFEASFPAVEGRSTAVVPDEKSMRRGSGEHILVVDDEPSLVRIASRILDRLGYRVTAHTRPAEALADFLERPDDFDLVLSDLTMPRMTGLDLASLMLERRPDLPILLTSGYSGSLDPDELTRVGIRELVGKPFLAQTIADAVARGLNRT